MHKMRTFRAPSMPEALALVKRELGPGAVILGTRGLPTSGLGRLVRRDQVEITAAPPETPTGAPRPAAQPGGPPALPEQVHPYFRRLVENEVAEQLAERLLRTAARTMPARALADGNVLRGVLRKCIARMIPTAEPIATAAGSVRRVALIGPPGGGKTTTLAKLAAHVKLRARKQVGLLSLDMHRLAANAQLQRYADIIRVPMESAQTVPDVQDACRQLAGLDCLLIDTPGVGPRERGRFARLAALLRAARPDEVHLVVPACTAATAQVRIAEAFAPLGVSRVVLTHLDEAVGFGVILNAMDKLKWELSYITAGQNVPRDIEEACSRRVAELILPVTT